MNNAESHTPFTTIDQLLERFAAELPITLVDFVRSGAGSELALRRNRAALERLALEQRLLVAEGPVDISTSFLGVDLASPVITAPMGMVQKVWPEGDVAVAVAAASEGCMAVIANETEASLETIADRAPGAMLAQFRCANEPSVQEAKLAALHSRPQYRGICVTVDGPVQTRIDRFIETGTSRDTGGFVLRVPGHRFTWSDIAQLRSQTSLPMGLKGIMHADDALAAIDHGADFVWVSNHGARKLDAVRATIEVLDEVVAAVDGQVPVIVDSGFQRGSDAVKALARGATLVAVGKLTVCALGLAGGEGVSALLGILHEELRNAIACTGSTALAQLRPDMVQSVNY